MAPIAIELNGESHSIAGDRRLVALIEKLGLKPSRIAVELNLAVVPRTDYAQTMLRAGDCVEIINFVGGG